MKTRKEGRKGGRNTSSFLSNSLVILNCQHLLSLHPFILTKTKKKTNNKTKQILTQPRQTDELSPYLSIAHFFQDTEHKIYWSSKYYSFSWSIINKSLLNTYWVNQFPGACLFYNFLREKSSSNLCNLLTSHINC